MINGRWKATRDCLAKHGFVVVTINYRLAPKYKFPAQVDDVRDALVWTAKNAEQLSIDLTRLGMFGYSAGGHLSTLVSMLADEPPQVQLSASDWTPNDPRWKQMPKVHAVCAGGPPCEFRDLPIDNTTLAYFLGGSRRERPDVYELASPTSHASAGDPITQIIHGESDMLVPIVSSRRVGECLEVGRCRGPFRGLPQAGSHGDVLESCNPAKDAVVFSGRAATVNARRKNLAVVARYSCGGVFTHISSSGSRKTSEGHISRSGSRKTSGNHEFYDEIGRSRDWRSLRFGTLPSSATE